METHAQRMVLHAHVRIQIWILSTVRLKGGKMKEHVCGLRLRKSRSPEVYFTSYPRTGCPPLWPASYYGIRGRGYGVG